ncbi:TRP-domain-containing protein [Durotheca rogersii]|uniref:TRP-domain-containing protein n=1 Tax=Durotheca rogersii TaxID=419775 RepID=UPI00221F14D9|nr:TRP-domain-containing protein [Durotheca rogersii]KAI5868320.1 TRP-domain-containing protein [Durotheca rogersii]
MAVSNSRWNVRRAAIWAMALATGVLGDDRLVTKGFTNCEAESVVRIQQVDISFSNSDKIVVFDIAGVSSKRQNVTATLAVSAYGQDIYTKSFNPCDEATLIAALCPAPAGSFSARGSQAVPAEYAGAIPGIAFQMPDIVAQATLKLKSLDDGAEVGCVRCQITNGKSAVIPTVAYIAAGVAGAALLVGGVGAVGATLSGGAGAGGGTISPSFTEMLGVFQGFAMNGMMTGQLPQVYRSFTQNFAFSSGLIPWMQMQISIDNFRGATGGNLTRDSVEYLLKSNFAFQNGSVTRRSLDGLSLAAREIETQVSGTTPSDESFTAAAEATIREAVSGIKQYAEQLSVPQSNTFMTVLLIVAIVVAVIVVGILLIKVVLEVWALYGNLPASLTGLRKHYWGSIARALTSLVLLLYGIWVLYCVFQLTHGDSWAAQALACVTLLLFTGILAFFSWKIWTMARQLKNTQGDTSALYEDKKIWFKYSLFYESYKKDYWWVFVPVIFYMFIKGCVLAATDGHGMAQAVSLLFIEGLMLALLVWSRPFERKSGNVINIMIQVVRVLSVICVFIFLEEFGLAQTTQTVAGVILVGIQSALAVALALLIACNAIVACVKQNPHRRRRKEMEKMQRDLDDLTPLDARNSLLMERNKSGESINYLGSFPMDKKASPAYESSGDRYIGVAIEPANPYAAVALSHNRSLTPGARDQGRESLVLNAAPMGQDTRGGY